MLYLFIFCRVDRMKRFAGRGLYIPALNNNNKKQHLLLTISTYFENKHLEKCGIGIRQLSSQRNLSSWAELDAPSLIEIAEDIKKIADN